MQQEILSYIEYLESFNELKKPKMPSFDLNAYTDNEYYKAINEIQETFDRVDDFQVYLKFLKGE